jgi:serine protease
LGDEKKSSVRAVFFAACLVVAGSLRAADAPVSTPYAPDQIIVKFRSSTPRTAADELCRRYGLADVKTQPAGRFRQLRVPAPLDARELAAEYSRMPEVEYAELNYYLHSLTVNDPYYPVQWYLWDANAGVNAEAAWSITAGDPGIVVAVVDSGIAYENYHNPRTGKDYYLAPDLAGTHFVAGRNFVANPDTSHANDDHGHGTFVAGVIAQTTNNGIGSAGVAWNCSLMPVKVLDSEGSGLLTDICDGIEWAVDNGAHVINLSLGMPAESETLRDSLIYARNANVTVVCSAGNSYENGNPVFYPAAYHDYCIAVGATQYDRTHAHYSETGFYIDVVAPGGCVHVDQNGDGWVDGLYHQTFVTLSDPSAFTVRGWEGTSLSAAEVSAIAALLYSRGVNDPDRVEKAIAGSARDLGQAGRDDVYGWGLVDAAAALRYYEIPGDLNADYTVNGIDLLEMCDHWLENYAPADIAPSAGDGIVNCLDLAALAANWGIDHR